MTPAQAKKIAEQALTLHGWAFDKLTAKTVSFSGFGYGEALFVTARGLRDSTPESHLDKPTRFAAAKAICKAAGFILEAF